MSRSADNIVHINPKVPSRRVIQRAVTILRRGGLVAFPTETVYGLGAHALDIAALLKIFAAKQRPEWDPLIVHVRNGDAARALTINLPPQFEALTARFWPGPLTLVLEKAKHVPDLVTAFRPTVALRVPNHPVALALLHEGLPIAAPSANRFGHPSPTRAEHVAEDLGKKVDLILDAGPTQLGIESTVLDLTQSPPAILRPGGVTREELAAVLGEVVIAPGISEKRAAKGLAGPGMTLKHYAPRAAVELFEGDLGEMAENMTRRLETLRAGGKHTGAIVCDELFGLIEPLADYPASFGKWGDWPQMARRLFTAMRVMDAQNVAVILCVLPPAEGLGLAIRDRLQRAAGVKVAGGLAREKTKG